MVSYQWKISGMMTTSLVVMVIRESMIFGEVQNNLAFQYKEEYIDWRREDQSWFDELFLIDRTEDKSEETAKE